MINNKVFDEIVVCLFDGEYHLGFAAFANSIAKANFKGLIHVGYRQTLPVWVSQLEKLDGNYFLLTKEIYIQFQWINPDMHFGYFKPYFLRQTFDTFKTCQKFYYFDVDILVIAPWHLFSTWLDKGICVCLDVSFPIVHHNHPWRKEWKRLMPEIQKSSCSIDYYFNSGFLGIERESFHLIDKWICFTKKYAETGGNIHHFEKDAYRSFKGDQDLLNAAITVSPEVEISVWGLEGMGFNSPATIMLHAIDETKPWNKKFVKFLFQYGQKPSRVEKMFFDYCKYPINVFSRNKLSLRRLDLKIASFFGRLIG